jgi:hypothetical protein
MKADELLIDLAPSGLATNRQEPELRPTMRLNERFALLAPIEIGVG